MCRGLRMVMVMVVVIVVVVMVMIVTTDLRNRACASYTRVSDNTCVDIRSEVL